MLFFNILDLFHNIDMQIYGKKQINALSPVNIPYV